jgi:hypothetical protein
LPEHFDEFALMAADVENPAPFLDPSCGNAHPPPLNQIIADPHFSSAGHAHSFPKGLSLVDPLFGIKEFYQPSTGRSVVNGPISLLFAYRFPEIRGGST